MISFIRLSALGDIIHSTIITQFLEKNNIKFDFLVDNAFKDILSYSNFNVVGLSLKNKNFLETYKICKNLNYDVSVDLQGLIKSAIVGKISSKYLIGCDYFHTKEKLALLFYDKKLKIRNHSIFRYIDMINLIFDIKVNYSEVYEHEPYLNYSNKDFIYKEYFSQNKKNIIFIIGASADYKIYPKEKWVDIANSLKENILIPYGNEKEKKIAEFIASKSSYVKILPKMNLTQLKAHLSNADLIIGNDTGPTYIGWANNIKTIIIYGPVEANKVVENKYTRFIKAKTKTSPNKIDKNDFSIQKIDIKEILNAVESF